MTARVAINGFGRIGRLTLRAMLERHKQELNVVAMNIVPTSTGAAKAIGLVMPELKGKLHGLSLRVPTSTVSVVDLVVDLKELVSVEDLNNALKKAAEGKMKGILAYSDEPLVSSDFRGNSASSIVDGLSTVVLKEGWQKFFPGTITSGVIVVASATWQH